MTQLWLKDVQEILAKVRYKNWEWNAREVFTEDAEAQTCTGSHIVCGTLIWVSFMAPTGFRDDPQEEPWNSRKWYVSIHATESEVVQTALLCVLQAEEHEAREAFHYKHAACFSPYIAVQSHIMVSSHLEKRP